MPNVVSKLKENLLMPEWSFPYNCYEIGHTWDPSCTKSIWDITKTVLYQSLLMYSGLYTFSLIAFNRKIDRQSIMKAIDSIITSTSFLTFNGFSMFAFFCAVCKMSDKIYYSLLSAIPAFAGSLLAIQIEKPSRRGALAVYCANIASECLYRIAVKRNYFKPIANGETVLFTAAMSILLYIIRKNGYGKDPISFALRLLLGSEEAKRRRKRNDINENEYESQFDTTIPLSKCDDFANNNLIEPNTFNFDTNAILNALFRMRHPTCEHVNDSCFGYALKGFGRPFLIGWLSQSLLSTFIKPKRFLNDPYILFRSMRSSRTVKFATFLGAFGAVYKVINCCLRWMCHDTKHWHAFVAGLFAGPAMLLSPSTTIATYVLWKCIETIYCLAIQHKLAPYPNATIALVYAASVNIIFYTGILQPSCLRPSYFRFIDRVTDHRLHLLNRNLLAIFGTDASDGFEEFFPDLKPQLCTRQFLETVMVWML